jgi:hypothetical protein
MSSKRRAGELKVAAAAAAQAAAQAAAPEPAKEQLAASPRVREAEAGGEERAPQRRRVAALAAEEAADAVAMLVKAGGDESDSDSNSDSSGEEGTSDAEEEGEAHAGVVNVVVPATCATVLARVARSKLIASASSVFGTGVVPAGSPSLDVVVSNLIMFVQASIQGSKLKKRRLAGVLKNLSTKDIPGGEKLAGALDEYLRASLAEAKQECERTGISFSSQAFKQLADDAKSEAKAAGDGEAALRADQASSHQVYAALELPDTGGMSTKERAKERVRALLATYSLALDERVRPRKMRKLFRGSAGTYSEMASQFARGVLLAGPGLFQVQPYGPSQLSQAALEELDEDTKGALEDLLIAASNPMPSSSSRSKSNESPMHGGAAGNPGGLTPSSSSRASNLPAKQPVTPAGGVPPPPATYLDVAAEVTRSAEVVNKAKSEFDRAVITFMCHLTSAEEKLPASIYDKLMTSQAIKDAKRHQ